MGISSITLTVRPSWLVDLRLGPSTWGVKKVCQRVLIKFFGLQNQNQNPRFHHKNAFFAFLGAAIDSNCHAATGPSRTASSG